MARSFEQIRVFLASPGDLADERRIVKRIADDVNRSWKQFTGCQIELVGWEDTLPGFGRPQEIINRELRTCDYFIGMVWKTWGTPPDVDGRYQSGFEEEFEIARQSRTENGTPEISIFFKNVDSQQESDPGDQLRKVLLFRDKIEKEKIALYKKFYDMEEFEKVVRFCLENYMQRQADATMFDSDRSTDVAISAETSTDSSRQSDEDREFLRSFLDSASGKLSQNPNENFKWEPSETARLRLVASLSGSAANDKLRVGPHDANLIHHDYHVDEMSRRELTALSLASLSVLNHRNIPLWRWLVGLGQPLKFSVSWLSLVGDDQEIVGAIRALRMIGATLHDPEIHSREAILRRWFVGSTDQVVTAAMVYISQFGTKIEYEMVQAQVETVKSNLRSITLKALIDLTERFEPQRLLEYCLAHNPDTISDTQKELIVEQILKEDSFSFVEALKSPSANFRECVARAASNKRQTIGLLVKFLRSDDSEKVRIFAAEYLARGENVDWRLVRRVLSGAEKGAFFFGSVLGGAKNLVADRATAKLMWKYLASSAQLESVDSEVEWIALIKHDVQNEFDRFGTLLKILEKPTVWAIEKLRAREVYRGLSDDDIEVAISKVDWTNIQFSCFVKIFEFSEGKNFEILKEMLPNLLFDLESEAGLVEVVAAYFAKFGQFDDIFLVLNWIEKCHEEKGRGFGLGIFSEKGRNREVVAKCFVGIATAKNIISRIDRFDSDVLEVILRQMKNQYFRKIDDDVLFGLISHVSDRLREVVCCRMILTLPKKRVLPIYERYRNETTMYYNVIFWLDLYDAVTVEEARRICEYEIRTE